MKKVKLLKVLPACLALVAMALFLIRPARYGESVLRGVSVWAVSVLPATFPFLFLSALFAASPLFARMADLVSRPAGTFFRVSGDGACTALLAMVSGYPVGARCIFDLHKDGLLGEEKFRLACLATTSGPMFLVGTVGSGMWGSPALGWLLLFCHLFGVWTVSFLLSRFAPPPKKSALFRLPPRKDLFDMLSSAVVSILYVGGSIALFTAFGQMLADAFPPTMSEVGSSVLRGLVEMTTGCAALAKCPSSLSLALSCFLVTFGGACVLCQEIGFLYKAGVKPLPFLAVKFLQGILAGGMCYALALFIYS